MEEFRPIEPEETYITETHSSPEPIRQPVFESKAENGEESYRNFYDVLAYRKSAVMTIAYFIYCAALFVLSMILYKKTELIYTIAIAALFAVSVVFYFLYKKTAKKTVERIKYMNNGDVPTVTNYFFEDEIVSVNDDPDKTLTFRYEDVKKLSETDLLYLVEVKHKLSLLVSKNFKSDRSESFEDFIISKADAVKKKKNVSPKKYKTLAIVFLALNGLLAAASVVLYFVIK